MSKASALSKLGNVTAATRAKAGELWEYMHSKGYDLTRFWGMGPGDEHGVGRALDLMITGLPGSDKEAGDLIAAYLWSNRKRLQVKWEIWWDRIRSTSPGKTGNWEEYSGPSEHKDHVHVFFGTGGYVPPAGAGGGGGTVAKTVDLSKIIAAAKADPKRKQGGTTPGAAASVKIVEDALRREKLLSTKFASDGSFGTLTVKAYAAWQRELGFKGSDADGIPGRNSLERLGRKYGWKVKA